MLIIGGLCFFLLLGTVVIGIAAIPVTEQRLTDAISMLKSVPLEIPVLNRHRRNGMRKRNKRKKNKKVPNAGHNFAGKPKSPELKQPKSESKYCSSNCEGKRKRHL